MNEDDALRGKKNPFGKVQTDEHAAINARRCAQGRPDIWPNRRHADDAANDTAGFPIYNTFGVSLSGGGIRSAAFCLGALQALGAHPFSRADPGPDLNLFDRVDYMSSVSGGGYVASSVSAGMAKAKGFPFSAPNEFEDRLSVGHLRDYSNYILPRGSDSMVDAIAVVLRGLITNLVFIFSGIFLFAWFTATMFPYRGNLVQGGVLRQLIAGALHLINWLLSYSPEKLTLGSHNPIFEISGWLFLLLLAFLLLWSLWRSFPFTPRGNDVSGWGIWFTRGVIWFVLFGLALDLHPLLIEGFFQIHDRLLQQGDWAKTALSVLTAVSGGIAVFHDRLAWVLKANADNTGPGALLKRFAALAAVWLAALVLPLMLLLLAVWISASAICDPCHKVGFPISLAENYPNALPLGAPLYGWLGFGLAVVTLLFAPNANSLHQLYRDKLSKAFLFNPAPTGTPAPASGQAAPDDGDLPPLDTIKLTDISGPNAGPYHLINAAVNLQNSIHANRRGRDAGFFLFSPLYVGSDITDFVPTQIMQEHDPHIDLGTAMAISGAAVSANMGSSSIPALAPTLALLNIRLGYWLTNPSYLLGEPQLWTVLSQQARRLLPKRIRGAQPARAASVSDTFKDLRRKISSYGKGYLFAEMFGRLNENKPFVYLTDGGHIENLGLYQLLKRHCRVIVAVDGEADPSMSFRALATMERYARIDMGVRIELPWQELAKTTNDITKESAESNPVKPRNGPHCAVGVISYPNGQKGVLVYVKSSLSGDEPDYIMDYKRRYPAFPHESTGDQFFTEEQFEVYRALGFHALDGFLRCGQNFAWAEKGPWPVSSREGVRDYVMAELA